MRNQKQDTQSFKTHKRMCNGPELFKHLTSVGSLAVLAFPAVVKEKRQAVLMGKKSIQDKSLWHNPSKQG